MDKTDSSQYECDWCNETFKSIEQLKVHELTSCPELQQPKNSRLLAASGVPSTESISKLITQITGEQQSSPKSGVAKPTEPVDLLSGTENSLLSQKPSFGPLSAAHSLAQLAQFGNSPRSVAGLGNLPESAQLREVLEKLSARSRDHLSPLDSGNGSGLTEQQQQFLIHQHNQQRLRQSQFLANHHQNSAYNSSYISPNQTTSGPYQEYLKRLSATNSLYMLNEAIRSAKMANKPMPPLEKPGLSGAVPPPPLPPPQLLGPNRSESDLMPRPPPGVLKAPEPRPSQPQPTTPSQTRPAMCHMCRIQFSDIELLAKHYIECHPNILPGFGTSGFTPALGQLGRSGSAAGPRMESVIQQLPGTRSGHGEVSSPTSAHLIALSQQTKLPISPHPATVVTSPHTDVHSRSRLPPPPVS